MQAYKYSAAYVSSTFADKIVRLKRRHSYSWFITTTSLGKVYDGA